MERVRKTFFNPLATSKSQIREILEGLPVGSAHPFSPQRLLLCRTENGIDEIDISSYPEDFFFNAVDLGEMGETLLRRMANFSSQLKIFEDFQVVQAPAATFKVPIVSHQISMLAVSERTPTFYDFCFADASHNACCYNARNTFKGLTHSGDVCYGNDFLAYVQLDKELLEEKELCVFISGYQRTQITRFLGTYPAVLVADHVDKLLYIIPVPLDAATIGDATICCPLVIKPDGDSLICSILPTATTDREIMCSSRRIESPCFSEAIQRANFSISVPQEIAQRSDAHTTEESSLVQATTSGQQGSSKITYGHGAVIAASAASLPSLIDTEKTQVIRFGTGLNFELPQKEEVNDTASSSVVLPCIFGSQLEGPVLLATGTMPSNVPFVTDRALRNHYEKLNSVVVIVDDRMTDNARNLATSWRINALFIVQLSGKHKPKNSDDVLSILTSANINAVTALAGPQSLVLVQVQDKYYFYRGLANRAHLDTSGLAFGSDVTSVIESVGITSLTDSRIKRIINLDEPNAILLPASDLWVQPQDLQGLFAELPVDKINDLEEDISAAVPQLQALLNQKDLQELSRALVSTLSGKVNAVTGSMRSAYIRFLAEEYQMGDQTLAHKKAKMLGDLRTTTKELQQALEPAISSLANMMSSQTTSKRTHDLKRLVRQAQIQSNVEAVKSMTFETMAGYLETYAAEMGVMVLNIEETEYGQLLGNLKHGAIDASPACNLDSRILHLDGFDAGIIIEQSQSKHNGPLRCQGGPSQPILALPFLSQRDRTGSMLAWVCWDEFVDLKSPYGVRWMEKCNEPHIAALRIVMRGTLSQAVASREHNLYAASPEIGNLMSALLMAAMSKLAAMRTTAPVVLETAEDTVVRLMRGLFGNLLTIAGSGVRPLSFVWQLFGLHPQFDVPANDTEWVWYQTVVALYPFTGWPLEQFYGNLEKLLDKVIIRVVTKNEKASEIRQKRAADMIKFCKLRNIQLDHSRTIITVFMRMLTSEDVDAAAISARLLEELPHKLEKQSESYTMMINYLKHLAGGGQRRVNDDVTAANVYTKRSAAFAELKIKAADACGKKDKATLKACCQALVDQHAKTAALWQIAPERLKLQNLGIYKGLLDVNTGKNVDPETKSDSKMLVQKVLGDAEKTRVPWQVGKKGQFGDDIEPLDEAWVHELLTGELLASNPSIDEKEEVVGEATAALEQISVDPFLQFNSVLKQGFVTTMQKTLSAEDVCEILQVPVAAMRVFIKAINPDFIWEDLGENFKKVILELLRTRSNRPWSCPVKTLLGLKNREKTLQIEN